jgi:glycosyltransferase involved in cell wall biosynthesis
MKNLINEQNLTERIVMPGGISDKERNYLYHHCQALLFPSIAEGFGLPVIEAMLCNKPVFCSSKTSLKEIGGKYAFFWDDFVPEKMFEVYTLGLNKFNNPGFVENQMEYAQTYTYERNIQQYLKIYNELMEVN